MSGHIRVILIDDQLYIHQAMASLISHFANVELIGQGTNGLEAIRLCDEYKPDIVLMDILMPKMDGIEATSRIKEAHPAIKIVALSSLQDRDGVQAMIVNGASAYVLKDSVTTSLEHTIRAVHAGLSVISSEIADLAFTPDQNQPNADFVLTARELEVLKLTAKGSTNKTVAQQLSISDSTVRFHLQNVLAKMDVKTRAEAIALAAKHGLI